MIKDFARDFVCPDCRSDLVLHSDESDAVKVISGTMECTACKASFPIADGIPRFAALDVPVTKQSAQAFGYKWSFYRVIDENYKKNFLDELAPLDLKSFFHGKRVLDAGTGIGIPACCVAELGAETVFAIDINSEIGIAAANNAGFPNVCVAQADIYKIPLRRASFDVVVCVAVMQHLPDPAKAFAELKSFVKPGGSLVIWVYGREGNAPVQYFIEPFRKLVTRRLPLPLSHVLSKAMGVIFHVLGRCLYRPLDAVGIRCLPMHDYIVYRSRFPLAMNIHMIFDQLLAPLSHLFRREEVEALFRRDEFSSVTIHHHNGNSWTAIGTRKEG